MLDMINFVEWKQDKTPQLLKFTPSFRFKTVNAGVSPCSEPGFMTK